MKSVWTLLIQILKDKNAVILKKYADYFVLIYDVQAGR
jgi:hypothetical protein